MFSMEVIAKVMPSSRRELGSDVNAYLIGPSRDAVFLMGMRNGSLSCHRVATR
jgi:hypothetical protein